MGSLSTSDLLVKFAVLKAAGQSLLVQRGQMYPVFPFIKDSQLISSTRLVDVTYHLSCCKCQFCQWPPQKYQQLKRADLFSLPTGLVNLPALLEPATSNLVFVEVIIFPQAWENYHSVSQTGITVNLPLVTVFFWLGRERMHS